MKIFLDVGTHGMAVEELAKYLHWKQWHLDPEPDESAPPDWSDLSEADREFYRSSVEALLDNVHLVKVALSLA